jgi:hypothetical protein
MSLDPKRVLLAVVLIAAGGAAALVATVRRGPRCLPSRDAEAVSRVSLGGRAYDLAVVESA